MGVHRTLIHGKEALPTHATIPLDVKRFQELSAFVFRPHYIRHMSNAPLGITYHAGYASFTTGSCVRGYLLSSVIATDLPRSSCTINTASVIGKDKGQLLPHKRGTFIVQKDKFWVAKRHILFLSFNISHKTLSHKHLDDSQNWLVDELILASAS